MDAKDNQVFATGSEFHSNDVKVRGRKPRNLDVDDNESLVSTVEGLPASDSAYMAELAFLEEPVTIRISPSSEKNPARTVQCWVNGKGAEQLTNGRWMQCGWLPVGHIVTTRRKYVEVLARAKGETVSTRVVQHGEFEENFADRTASLKYPFSILKDENPRGIEWLQGILQDV